MKDIGKQLVRVIYKSLLINLIQVRNKGKTLDDVIKIIREEVGKLEG